MPEIDVRLDTGELDVKLRLHTERARPILDIEFAKGVTVNGTPDAYREFARDLLDLIDATCPPPDVEFADIPPHPERPQRMSDERLTELRGIADRNLYGAEEDELFAEIDRLRASHPGDQT